MDKPAREALKSRIDRELFGVLWVDICRLLTYVDELEAAVASYPRTKDGVLPTVGGSVFEAGWRSVEEHKVRLHGYTRYEFEEAIVAVEDCFSTYDAARAELDARQAQSEAS